MSNNSTAAPDVIELIPVFSGSIHGEQAQLVDARELHRFLEVDTHFKDWIARRIAEYGFQEGEDFCSTLSKSTGGRRSREYRITLDMGKELAMVERNEKGKQARRYFIECEKRLSQIAPEDARTIMGETIGTDGFHMLGAVVKGKVSSLPAAVQRRATMKIWSQTHAAFGVRSAADIPADQLDAARNFIAAYVVLEGEYIQAAPKDGITLDKYEASHLYGLMSYFSAMSRHREHMFSAAQLLDSKTLMLFFDMLNEGRGAFASLDKRRDELYQNYRSLGLTGGYAMGMHSAA
ncbi:Phage anti-repressor protein [Pseudomonas saponiphila]|uniref:Phage anti-repressor protein n=2 Tax=Pseudomonas saponiphila TaxID=556534 RepID=A0A1H4QZA1_9PSED|nr:Phage anti-repressor protein [Pseudomonas saponiphila]